MRKAFFLTMMIVCCATLLSAQGLNRLWVRGSAVGADGANYSWNTGSANRDIAVHDGIIYVASNAGTMVRVLDGATGDELPSITGVTNNGFGIAIDDAGNLFVPNNTGGGMGWNLRKVNTTTGVSTPVYGWTNPTARIDFFAARGDIESSESSFFIGHSINSNVIQAWELQDGAVTATFSSANPNASGTTGSSGADAFWIDDARVLLTSHGRIPQIITVDFSASPFVIGAQNIAVPAAPHGGGGVYFELGGIPYVVLPHSVASPNGGREGAINMFNITNPASPIQIGTTTPVIGTAGDGAVTHTAIHAEKVADNRVIVYVWAVNNGVAAYEVVAARTPILTPAPGTFEGSVTISSIVSETPNAVIRFTTDGSVPTSESPLFTGTPIEFATEGTHTIRLLTTAPGVLDNLMEATYTVTALPSGLAGTFFIPNTAAGQERGWATLTEAFAEINTEGIDGNVVLAITADIAQTGRLALANDTDYSITINSHGERRTIAFSGTGAAAGGGAAGQFVIGASGLTSEDFAPARNIIIDNLTLTTTGLVSSAPLLMFVNDVYDVTVKNSTILGTSGSNQFNLVRLDAHTAADMMPRNVRFENNTFRDNSNQTTSYAINIGFRGGAGPVPNLPVEHYASGIVITGNDFQNLGQRGIWFVDTDGVEFSNNRIEARGSGNAEMVSAAVTLWLNVRGYVRITGNEFSNIRTSNTQNNSGLSGMFAINVMAADLLADIYIENNYFSGFRRVGTGGAAWDQFTMNGILTRTVAEGFNTYIRHNTFLLDVMNSMPDHFVENPALNTSNYSAINIVSGMPIIQNNLFVLDADEYFHFAIRGDIPAHASGNVFYLLGEGARKAPGIVREEGEGVYLELPAGANFVQTGTVPFNLDLNSVWSGDEQLRVNRISAVATDIHGNPRGAYTHAGAHEPEMFTGTPTINAEIPFIIVHPQPETFVQGDTILPLLTVRAVVTDGGTLTYQWFSNTENSNTGGTIIDGATEASFAPPTEAIGTVYYYVVITNTNNVVNGEATASTTSDVAAITVEGEIINAQTPTITAQPQSADYIQNATAVALTVTANVTDGGTLTYQWFSNTENSNTGGTIINGATEASFTPSTERTGTVYYYVVITNTNTEVNGETTASIASDVAAITVELETGISIPAINSLNAWVHNGMLHITGLTAEKMLSIYTASGVQVYQSPAQGSKVEIPFNHLRGVHIVRQGLNAITVIAH